MTVYKPKFSDWKTLENTLANCNEGDILLDPQVAEDLKMEFGITEKDLEMIVESSNFFSNPKTFNVASIEEYEDLRAELIDRYGQPEEEQ